MTASTGNWFLKFSSFDSISLVIIWLSLFLYNVQSYCILSCFLNRLKKSDKKEDGFQPVKNFHRKAFFGTLKIY